MGENQTIKDKIRELLQTANAIGDAYLWGFHEGVRAMVSISCTGFDFENDLLRFHAGDVYKHFLSVYSPQGLEISKGPQGEAILNTWDAQRVRWDWLAGPGKKAGYLEFWKMDGDIYGKSNVDWPTIECCRFLPTSGRGVR